MEGGGGAMPAASEDVMQMNEAQASVVIILPMSDTREGICSINSIYYRCCKGLNRSGF